MSEINRSAAASVLSRNRLASFLASIRALAWAVNAEIVGAAHGWGSARDHIGEALKAMKGFETPIFAWRVHAIVAEFCSATKDLSGAEYHRNRTKAMLLEDADPLRQKISKAARSTDVKRKVTLVTEWS
jgi:hypothetical protein